MCLSVDIFFVFCFFAGGYNAYGAFFDAFEAQLLVFNLVFYRMVCKRSDIDLNRVPSNLNPRERERE